MVTTVPENDKIQVNQAAVEAIEMDETEEEVAVVEIIATMFSVQHHSKEPP